MCTCMHHTTAQTCLFRGLACVCAWHVCAFPCFVMISGFERCHRAAVAKDRRTLTLFPWLPQFCLFHALSQLKNVKKTCQIVGPLMIFHHSCIPLSTFLTFEIKEFVTSQHLTQAWDGSVKLWFCWQWFYNVSLLRIYDRPKFLEMPEFSSSYLFNHLKYDVCKHSLIVYKHYHQYVCNII